MEPKGIVGIGEELAKESESQGDTRSRWCPGSKEMGGTEGEHPEQQVLGRTDLGLFESQRGGPGCGALSRTGGGRRDMWSKLPVSTIINKHSQQKQKRSPKNSFQFVFHSIHLCLLSF